MSQLDLRDTLDQYEQAATQLLASSDKAVIARAARVLAVYVGYYQLRHGPIPPAELATDGEPLRSEEQLAERMEASRILAAALTVASAAAIDAD